MPRPQIRRRLLVKPLTGPCRPRLDALETRELPGSVLAWLPLWSDGPVAAAAEGATYHSPVQVRWAEDEPAWTRFGVAVEPAPETPERPTSPRTDSDRDAGTVSDRSSSPAGLQFDLTDVWDDGATPERPKIIVAADAFGPSLTTAATAFPVFATVDGRVNIQAPAASPSVAETATVGSGVRSALAGASVVASGGGSSAEQSAGPASATQSPGANDAGGGADAHGILIQFKAGFGATARAAVRGLVGGTLNEDILTGPMAAHGHGQLEVIDLPAGAYRQAALAALRANPAVEFAEPNWVLHHQADSNDPLYTNGSLWGMYGDSTTPANQYGSQAGEAWGAGHTGSSGVYVGIIDEGIDFNHLDLNDNIWANPYDPVDGTDNDGNGYVDDRRGWDFANNDNTIFDGPAKGKNTTDAHGTHVAGTIGAEGGNNAGVAGVNWRVTLISGKFLSGQGGTIANAIKAVDYFTDLKVRHELNIVATNNSWGGGGYSQAMKDAIDRAGAQNILFVAAAMNGGFDGRGDNNDTLPVYPASYDSPSVIAVAAIDSAGRLASFSNYGFASVDLGASGVGVYSTLPRGTYGSYSGTSMATPHVTGAVALYASTHAGASAAQIKQAILVSAVPTAALAGKTVTGGRLNVEGF